MKKLVGIVLLTATLGACATVRDAVVQDPEDQLSPSALVATQTARCERDARRAVNTPSTIPSPGNAQYGNTDTALDINRQIYWKCVNELPTTR